MGRSIYHRYVNNEVEEDGNNHPRPGGCMWGLIHVLDYHQWKNHNNLKNLLHHQQSIDTHVKGKVNPKTNDPHELQKLLKDKSRSHLVVNQNKNKKSIKGRIKALIAEEFFKKENVKKPKKSLQRTYSIHYLESLDDGLNKIHTVEDDGNMISLNSPQMELLDKPNQTSMGSIKNAKSSGKARLTKSGTFPTADLTRITNLKPTKLEHKKNDIWFPTGGEKLVDDDARVSEFVLPKYKMNFKTQSWSLDSDNEFIPGDRKSIPVSQKSNTELAKQRNDKMMVLVEESKQIVDPEAVEDKSKGSIDEESDKYIDLEETENVETLDSSASYKKDNADLLYVKEILEQSGLCRDVLHGAEQPLNTSEFEKMEDQYHRLLNDLIIEVITQIYDRSFTVYPTSSHVRPSSSANQFLYEVYASISKLLSRMPNRYQTLGDIVSRDFVRHDGWVNFQSESECVRLELEDIIFDELLEELLCP